MLLNMVGEYTDQFNLARSVCIEIDSNDSVELPESESYWQVQNAMCTNFYHGSPEFDITCKVFAISGLYDPKKPQNSWSNMEFMEYSEVQELLKKLDGELYEWKVTPTYSDEQRVYDLIEEALYLSDKEVSRDEIVKTVDSETVEVFLRDAFNDYMYNSETTHEFIPWFILTFLQGTGSDEQDLEGGSLYGDVAKNLAAIYFDVETDF